MDNAGLDKDKEVVLGRDFDFGQDFDRGMVQMVCDKRAEGCNYGLPHYHCKICGKQVNSDERRRDYHPCCSEECIKTYNKRFDTTLNTPK